MMWRNVLIGLVLASLWPRIKTHRILFYSPSLSPSHMVSNARMADLLADAGHEVTLLVVENVMPVKDMLFAKKAKTVVLQEHASLAKNNDVLLKAAVRAAFEPDAGILGSFAPVRYQRMSGSLADACDSLLRMHDDVLNELRAANFDMLFAEQLDFCGIGLKHALHAKALVWISSCPLATFMSALLGNPYFGSYVPTTFYYSTSDKMTFYGRVRNLLANWQEVRVFNAAADQMDVIFGRHFGDDFPSVRFLARDADLVLVLTDEFLDFPKPRLPHVVHVGGFERSESQLDKLSPTFQKLASQGRKGFVLFALGSVLKFADLPVTAKQTVLKAMGALPDYFFAVQADPLDPETAQIAAKYDNIELVAWMPQRALLHHPRLRLFVSHGGYNSFIECARAGKPILVLPFVADQHLNGNLAERNGFGKTCPVRNLIERNDFRAVMEGMLADASITVGAERMRKLMLTKPGSGPERLLQWIQFLGDNDGRLPELQVEGRHLSWVQLYNCDIYATVLVAMIFLFWILAQFVRFLVHRFLRYSRTKAKMS